MQLRANMNTLNHKLLLLVLLSDYAITILADEV